MLTNRDTLTKELNIWLTDLQLCRTNQKNQTNRYDHKTRLTTEYMTTGKLGHYISPFLAGDSPSNKTNKIKTQKSKPKE